MKQQKIGIIMNGVTGRMGTNQHLVRSIVAIRKQGGVVLPDARDRVHLRPVKKVGIPLRAAARR